MRTVSPHYALFSAPAEIGSRHDYAIFKKHYQRYEEYLRKTPAERNDIPEDEHNSFAIVGDKAYQGPATDTGVFRRYSS